MRIAFLLMALLVAACAPTPRRAQLTIMTHDSFSVSEGLVQAFEDANDVTVAFVKSGDAEPERQPGQGGSDGLAGPLHEWDWPRLGGNS